MERIKKYLKNNTAKNLHNLRIECRRKLSYLSIEGLSNTGCEEILKKSSKLRDTDVMLKICKNKKIRKILKKKRKKLNKKFLKVLKNIEFKTVIKEKTDFKNVKKSSEILKESFLNKTDKDLHKIRLIIKGFRYTNPEYEEEFKKIQDALGKAHDYYKYEKLLKKHSLDFLKAFAKKITYIKKAEKARKKLLKVIGNN